MQNNHDPKGSTFTRRNGSRLTRRNGVQIHPLLITGPSQRFVSQMAVLALWLTEQTVGSGFDRWWAG